QDLGAHLLLQVARRPRLRGREAELAVRRLVARDALGGGIPRLDRLADEVAPARGLDVRLALLDVGLREALRDLRGELAAQRERAVPLAALVLDVDLREEVFFGLSARLLREAREARRDLLLVLTGESRVDLPHALQVLGRAREVVHALELSRQLEVVG